MKKLLALILAGAMVASVSVIAFAEESSGEVVEGWVQKDLTTLTESEEDLQYLYDGGWLKGDSISPSELGIPANVLAAYYAKFGGGSSEDSDSSDGGDSESAEAPVIESTGIPMETTLAAADENKSVGEYMNNAVVAAPGLDEAVPVSQGGNVIINGAPSNQTFSVLKVLSGHTESAKAQAASVGGKVLNVARIDASVYFDTATVNFYMPGVKTGQNIQVYQYDYTSGQWTGVAVAEVREDHVVVDMTSLGVLAFIEVPAAE